MKLNRKGGLASYDLMDALARNPTWIQAGADISAEATAEIERLTAEREALAEALQNAMGYLDTPIGRRKLGIDASAEWLDRARAALAKMEDRRDG